MVPARAAAAQRKGREVLHEVLVVMRSRNARAGPGLKRAWVHASGRGGGAETLALGRGAAWAHHPSTGRIPASAHVHAHRRRRAIVLGRRLRAETSGKRASHVRRAGNAAHHGRRRPAHHGWWGAAHHGRRSATDVHRTHLPGGRRHGAREAAHLRTAHWRTTAHLRRTTSHLWRTAHHSSRAAHHGRRRAYPRTAHPLHRAWRTHSHGPGRRSTHHRRATGITTLRRCAHLRGRRARAHHPWRTGHRPWRRTHRVTGRSQVRSRGSLRRTRRTRRGLHGEIGRAHV